MQTIIYQYLLSIYISINNSIKLNIAQNFDHFIILFYLLKCSF